MTQSKKSSVVKSASDSSKPVRKKPAAGKAVPRKGKGAIAGPALDPVATERLSAARKIVPIAEEEIYVREYWTGDSRDGVLVNGDGYHYYRMTKAGKILEAYEYYESDDGREFASPLPEMLHVHWINDLGFEDFEALDAIKEYEFLRIKDISSGTPAD